jgi:hypothetical protein
MSDRWLAPAQAAAYINVRPDALPRLVKQGRVPPPSYSLGKRLPRYDREALDALFAGGAASNDIDQGVEALLQSMDAEARRKKAARGRVNS